MKIAALILAAGESRRLGQPKQLLKHRGNTLVSAAVQAAIIAGVDTVFVVTGAFEAQVIKALNSLNCKTVHNKNWQQGQGSSVACGLQTIMSEGHFDFVLITTCDQPLIPVTHLQELVARSYDGAQITATQYSDQSGGIPACFHSSHFPALAELTGPKGARQLIYGSNAMLVPCSEAAFDIDTKFDLDRLQ